MEVLLYFRKLSGLSYNFFVLNKSSTYRTETMRNKTQTLREEEWLDNNLRFFADPKVISSLIHSPTCLQKVS